MLEKHLNVWKPETYTQMYGKTLCVEVIKIRVSTNMNNNNYDYLEINNANFKGILQLIKHSIKLTIRQNTRPITRKIIHQNPKAFMN